MAPPHHTPAAAPLPLEVSRVSLPPESVLPVMRAISTGTYSETRVDLFQALEDSWRARMTRAFAIRATETVVMMVCVAYMIRITVVG